MGGGRVTRPGFDIPQADKNDPLTEFYQLLQKALSKTGRFALPPLYAVFDVPEGEKPYAEEMWSYCAMASEKREGYELILPPTELHVLYDNLCVADSGAPAALILTEESTRKTIAVQILPPFVCGDEPIPPIPESTAALTLQLDYDDMLKVEQGTAALGRVLAQSAARKTWVRHPTMETWLMTKLAAAQRIYEFNHGQRNF